MKLSKEDNIKAEIVVQCQTLVCPQHLDIEGGPKINFDYGLIHENVVMLEGHL